VAPSDLVNNKVKVVVKELFASPLAVNLWYAEVAFQIVVVKVSPSNVQ
jgi:hypothetical protein